MANLILGKLKLGIVYKELTLDDVVQYSQNKLCGKIFLFIKFALTGKGILTKDGVKTLLEMNNTLSSEVYKKYPNLDTVYNTYSVALKVINKTENEAETDLKERNSKLIESAGKEQKDLAESTNEVAGDVLRKSGPEEADASVSDEKKIKEFELITKLWTTVEEAKLHPITEEEFLRFAEEINTYEDLNKVTETEIKPILNYLPHHKDKCRFFQFPCVKDSAVYVENMKGQQEYFPANFIGKYAGSKKTYIVTQAPLAQPDGYVQTEYRNFWKVAIDNNCLILNLTNEKDTGRGATIYFPEIINDSETYGDITVTLRNKEQLTEPEELAGNFVYTFDVKCGDKIYQDVPMLHYTQWIDFGTVAVKKLQALIDFIDEKFKDKSCLTHCLAGMGRSGTYITSAIGKEKINDGKMDETNHKNKTNAIMLSARVERGEGLIQTDKQYALPHDYVKTLLNIPIIENKPPKDKSQEFTEKANEVKETEPQEKEEKKDQETENVSEKNGIYGEDEKKRESLKSLDSKEQAPKETTKETNKEQEKKPEIYNPDDTRQKSQEDLAKKDSEQKNEEENQKLNKLQTKTLTTDPNEQQGITKKDNIATDEIQKTPQDLAKEKEKDIASWKALEHETWETVEVEGKLYFKSGQGGNRIPLIKCFPYDDRIDRFEDIPSPVATAIYISENERIHANRVGRFITTQAPKVVLVNNLLRGLQGLPRITPIQTGYRNFWYAMIQENCGIILNLTNANDMGGPLGVTEYAPIKVGSSMLVVDIEVTLEEIQEIDDFQEMKVRTYTVKLNNGKIEETRTIKSYNYTGWPDQQPISPEQLNKLVVFCQKEFGNKLVTVHCRAGAGRTGTYIEADDLNNQMLNGTSDININNYRDNIRKSVLQKRKLAGPSFVQKDTQYYSLFDYYLYLNSKSKNTNQDFV